MSMTIEQLFKALEVIVKEAIDNATYDEEEQYDFDYSVTEEIFDVILENKSQALEYLQDLADELQNNLPIGYTMTAKLLEDGKNHSLICISIWFENDDSESE